MLVWSWGTWPDPVIDFGREIYVPWRLSQGEVLYRDIVSYFNGPLSPYAHALLFQVLGPSLRVLVIFNLILIALLAGMLYRLMATTAGELAATAGGIVFFVLFAFAQLVQTGNYNYVCPYSYELPHGITLTVAGILFLWRWMQTRRVIWLAASGAMLGLVSLTKAEVFLAAGAAMGCGLLATRVLRRADALQNAVIFLTAAITPPVAAWGALCLVMSPEEAFRGILGAWNFASQRELLNLPFFRQLAGTDNIPSSIATILIWVGGYLLVFGPAISAGFLWRRGSVGVPAVSTIAFLLVAAIGFLGPQIDWNNFIRPAPLLLLVLIVSIAAALTRRHDQRLVLMLMLSVWALALLAKMPLHAHVYHYGFALAMPATLVLVCLLVGWIPRLIEQAGGSGWPLRAVVVGVLGVALFAQLRVMNMFVSSKTSVVGTGADRFYADARGRAINDFVVHITRSTRPGDTLVMIPEGLIANYLARRINPTGQLNFTPPALVMYGEDAMLNAFQRHPPDWIVILNIDTSEYGAKHFGADYARRMGEWINANYRRINAPDHLHPAMRMLRRNSRQE